MYEDLLKPLVNKFTVKLFKGAEYTQRTYVDHDSRMAELVQGVVAVQYTPWDHNGGDDSCTRQAKVRMFYENNREPVMEKTWDANSNQGNSKRRRDDSCSQFPFASFQSKVTPLTFSRFGG